MYKRLITGLAAVMVLVAPNAFANLQNAGFETGNFQSWSLTVPTGGSANVVTSFVGNSTTYPPVEGQYFARLKSNGPGSETMASQTVSVAGGSLSGYAAFSCFEGGETFDDYAYVRIYDAGGAMIAEPWSVSCFDFPDTFDSAWMPWSYTPALAGDYTVVYGVANALDSIVDAYAIFDDAAGEPARFKVTKSFVPFSSAPVDVSMQCNNGLPGSASATVDGGDSVGHTFVLTQIEGQGNVSCTITEAWEDSGYSSNLPNGCTFNNVVPGALYNCNFVNTGKPATYRTTKEWETVREGGDVINESGQVEIWCTAPAQSVSNASYIGFSGGYYKYRNSSMQDGEQMYVVLATTSSTLPKCLSAETGNRTDFERSYSANCSLTTLTRGETTDCVITNTVFFEGIPTLSQYGMAIMALLMLGLGFVGFRRFV